VRIGGITRSARATPPDSTSSIHTGLLRVKVNGGAGWALSCSIECHHYSTDSSVRPQSVSPTSHNANVRNVSSLQPRSFKLSLQWTVIDSAQYQVFCDDDVRTRNLPELHLITSRTTRLLSLGLTHRLDSSTCNGFSYTHILTDSREVQYNYIFFYYNGRQIAAKVTSTNTIV